MTRRLGTQRSRRIHSWRWAIAAAAVLTGMPVAAAPAHAGEPQADESTQVSASCVGHVDRALECALTDDDAVVHDEAVLPEGLELVGGRLTGTPAEAGVFRIAGTLADGTSTETTVTVSDVEYIAATITPNGAELIGVRWDGSRTTLLRGLKNGVRDIGIGPDGTVYVLTASQLQRVVTPGQTEILLDGLAAHGLHAAPDGDVHVATTKGVVTLTAGGRELLRPREHTVAEVIEDRAGDIWTIESGRVFRQDVSTGDSIEYPTDGVARSLALNRDDVLVYAGARQSIPDQLFAIHADGERTLIRDRVTYTAIAYSDVFGLVHRSSTSTNRVEWENPLDAREFLPNGYAKVALAEHLAFDEPPVVPLVDEFNLDVRTLEPDSSFARLRLAYQQGGEWSTPGQITPWLSVAADGLATWTSAVQPRFLLFDVGHSLAGAGAGLSVTIRVWGDGHVLAATTGAAANLPLPAAGRVVGVDGLPSGLTLTDRSITGTPKAAGSFPITITYRPANSGPQFAVAARIDVS